MSDNDSGRFNSIVGSNTSDNPSWSHLAAFACCGSSLPVDNTCPVPRQGNGLCVVHVEDNGNATFFEAARDCTARKADVCSKSQMQALRNAGLFFGTSWTNDGADNDNGQNGGLFGTEPDDPNPNSTRLGYACCL